MEYARAISEVNDVKQTVVTPIERPFRMLFISSFILLQTWSYIGFAVGIYSPAIAIPLAQSIYWGMIILAVIAHLSVILMVTNSKKQLQNKEG